MPQPLRRRLSFCALLCALGVIAGFSGKEAEARKQTLPAPSERLSYRALTWDDYRVDDRASGLSAQTQTFLGYRLEARATGSGQSFTAIVASISFYGGMDRSRSWRRSIVDREDRLLLEHEQGHLDINEIKLRQLRALAHSDMPVGSGRTAKDALADLSRRMLSIYQGHVAEMQAAQRRYDDETGHGTREEVQREWTARLRRGLEMVNLGRRLPPTVVEANATWERKNSNAEQPSGHGEPHVLHVRQPSPELRPR